MVFLAFVELVIILLLCIIGITQVVIPLWNNKPIFPAFRGPGKVEHELGEVQEELDALKIEEEVVMKKKTAGELRRRLHQKDEIDKINND